MRTPLCILPELVGTTALFVFSLAAVTSLAGTGIAVGPIVGATLGGSTEQGEAVYGGRVTVDTTHDLSLELAILHLTDQPEEERLGVRVTGDVGITPVQLSARYSHDLVGDRLRGFVSGGAGYSFCEDADVDVKGLSPGGPVVQTGNPHIDRKNAWGWQMAAGVEWLATRNLVLSLEYRFSWMQNRAELTGLSSDTPEGKNAIRNFEHDFEDNNELGVLDIGMSWRF